MKWRKPKNKSEKKKLRNKIGKIHLQILRLKRGNICEIHDQKCTDNIGRMHILPVGKYPRSEFAEANIILACWFKAHYYLHHDPDDPRAISAKEKILKLRDEKTWDNLLIKLKKQDVTMPKHNMGYLQLLHYSLQEELENLKKRLRGGKR